MSDPGPATPANAEPPWLRRTVRRIGSAARPAIVATGVASALFTFVGIASATSLSTSPGIPPRKTQPPDPVTGAAAPTTPSTAVVPTAAPVASATTTTNPSAPLATYTGGGGTEVVELTVPPDVYLADITYTAADDLDSIVVTSMSSDFSEDHQDVFWWDGSESGRVFIGAYTDDMRFLQVEADGIWKIELYPLSAAESWSGGEVHGVGSDVLMYDGPAGVVSFACQGDGYLGVDSYYEYRNSVISEDCPTEGTAIIQDAPSFIVIDGEGELEWWLRV